MTSQLHCPPGVPFQPDCTDYCSLSRLPGREEQALPKHAVERKMKGLNNDE